MIWNELNNPAHWHGGWPGRNPWRIEDPGWVLGLRMIRRAAEACASRFPATERVFPGLAPIDPDFLELAADHGALGCFDAVAGHNFWLDFGPASVHGESGLEGLEEAVDRLRTAAGRRLGRAVPVILSEIGISSFSGDELQAWATENTLRVLERMIERVPSTRATWYSLFDLPEEYLVTSLYKPESHGETRHRKFGLFRFHEGGFRPKSAVRAFARRHHPERIGITQWFRMPWPLPEQGLTPEHARTLSYQALEAAPPLLRELDVEWLRINVTWCDWYCARTGDFERGMEWFDDLLSALSEFRLIITIFQAPPQLVRDPDQYAAGSVPRSEYVDGLRDTVLDVLARYTEERV